MVISIIVDIRKNLLFKLICLVIILVIFSFFKEIKILFEKNWLVDIDTTYNRVWIYNRTKNDKKIQSLLINNEHSSAMYKDSDELVYEYTKYYHLAIHFFPNFKDTLMLGWAWYSFPKSFLSTYTGSKIDVVEIDPKLTSIARKYFNLKDNKNLTIYHEDARVFLNKNKKKYDVIFWDAFSSHHSLPYQLTTKEAIEKKYNSLTENWVVILNIISAIDWEKWNFLQAEYKTYKSIFPQVYLFPVSNIINGSEVQNIILVALKSKNKPNFHSKDKIINGYLTHLRKLPIEDNLPILTDDYAPVDYYISKTI